MTEAEQDMCMCGHPRSEHGPLGTDCQRPDCHGGHASRMELASGRCGQFTWSPPIDKVALFRDDTEMGYDSEGRTGKIQCRLCGRRFHGWAGTTNHARVHVERGQAESDGEKKNFRFWIKAGAV